MRRYWQRFKVGDERVVEWFAWLPATVRSSAGTESRWLERVRVRQVFTDFRLGPDWWNAEFLPL